MNQRATLPWKNILPMSKLHYVTTQLPPALHQALKREAKARKLKLAEAFQKAVELWLARKAQ
jgi:hypothetical protein